MSALKRIAVEMKKMAKDTPEGVTAKPVKADDLMVWEAVITGPAGTPYAGGSFKLSIVFPANYPFKPPEVKFITKIYHCNVDDKGLLCGVDMLKDSWSPSIMLPQILTTLREFLGSPNPDSPLNADAAKLYKADQNKYNATVKEWVKKYASS